MVAEYVLTLVSFSMVNGNQVIDLSTVINARTPTTEVCWAHF